MANPTVETTVLLTTGSRDRALCGAKSFVFAKQNNKVLQGQAETLWPYGAVAPTTDPTAISNTR